MESHEVVGVKVKRVYKDGKLMLFQIALADTVSHLGFSLTTSTNSAGGDLIVKVL